jgi:G3E family GTPase
MNNGCICCTVRGDLVRIIHKLLKRKNSFDAILIETTGLADPAPVAQTFFVDEEIAERCRLDAILTVVDAKHLLAHLDEVKPEGVENESVEQVAFADRILMNKIDLVSDEDKAEVLRRIRGINAVAEVLEATYSRFDLNRVLGIKAFDLQKVLEVCQCFYAQFIKHSMPCCAPESKLCLNGPVFVLLPVHCNLSAFA